MAFGHRRDIRPRHPCTSIAGGRRLRRLAVRFAQGWRDDPECRASRQDCRRGAFRRASSAITVTLPSAHTSSSIWVREIHSGKAANCFMYYLDLTTTSPTSLSCGTITFDGSDYVALTEFGPIVNTCRYPPLCKVTEFLWDGPGQSPVPAVTDANNCPSGKSGTNPAGWLKPCGNGWVKRRYANELPSDDTLAALGEAVRVSEILRSQE